MKATTRLDGSLLGVQFRWPWLRAEGNGAAQLIEPVAEFVLAGSSNAKLPDDSALVAFDESDLFALNRFPRRRCQRDRLLRRSRGRLPARRSRRLDFGDDRRAGAAHPSARGILGLVRACRRIRTG